MAGAAWAVDGGEWQTSGDIQDDIVPGPHTVSFKAVSYWKTPAAQAVTVYVNATAALEAEYFRQAVYALGEIGDQEAWVGEELGFYVESSAGAVTASATPSPVGPLAIDPGTGYFHYTPSPEDRAPFQVTFQAGAQTETVIVAPVLRLPSEQEVITYVRPVPGEGTATGLSMAEETVAAVTSGNSADPFNYWYTVSTPQPTKRVTVSGETVVFQEGSDPYDLYNTGSANERGVVREMTVIAETVIVRSRLWLMGTNVTVLAKELRFEGPDACIVTTPYIENTRARSAIVNNGAASNGLDGLQAGSVTLRIASFYSSAERGDRFLLTGGNGQRGGEGRPGADGRDIPYCADMWNYRQFIDIAGAPTWYNVTSCHMDRRHDGIATSREDYDYGNANDWQPGNGGNAVADGKPGEPGDGGALISTLALSAYLNASGGAAGAAGNTQPGGAAGDPRPAYKLSLYYSSYTFSSDTYAVASMETHWSQAGANAEPPVSTRSVGSSGSFSTLSGQDNTWLTPTLLRSVLQQLRQAYINGHFDIVRTRLEEYSARLKAYPEAQRPEADRVDFAQLEQEVDALLYQVRNNLDYFGNPAGWVPMLSFEANLTAFNNEIEQSINTLFLTYWLKASNRSVGEAAGALGAAKTQMKRELDEAVDDFNENQTRVGALTIEAEAIAHEIETKSTELKNIEDFLLRQAESAANPWWKKALRIGGAVLNMIPVYQPALGAIGQGMNIASNADTQDPLDTVTQGVELASTFAQSRLDSKLSDYKNSLKKDELSDEDLHEANIDNLKGKWAQVSTGMGQLKDALKTQAPDAEVQAQLEKLKASHPRLKTLGEEIDALAKRKQAFAEQVAQTLTALARAAMIIDQNVIGLGAINESLGLASNAKLSDRTRMYLDEMESRTKDRLLKYQYWMAKSFEYRLVREYPGTLNLDPVFQEFIKLLSARVDSSVPLTDPRKITPHQLTQTEFTLLKQVYLEELQQITSVIFEEMNNNAPDRSVPVTFSLSQDEIDMLNDKGFVYVNLKEKGLFGSTEENLRLVSIEVDGQGLEARPSDGAGYGSTALLRLRFEHTGDSRIESKGRVYAFNHYRNSQVNPITWSAVYDGIRNTVQATQISAASNSLLRTLLYPGGAPADADLVLYSRPAAWADILITKEAVTSTGTDMIVENLPIRVTYDYAEKRFDQSDLELMVSDGLMPTFLIDRTDNNGRRDGVGQLVRNYGRNSIVTVTAPTSYGTYVFQRWEEVGNRLTKALLAGPELKLGLTGHKRVRAVYVNTADIEPPAEPAILTNGGQGFTTGLATVVLTGTASTDTAEVRVDGVPATLQSQGGQMVWTASVTLAVGTAAYRVTALDAALNESGPATIEIYYLPTYDRDNDGLTDAEEAGLGTNPILADTDGDGMPDGWERGKGFDPLNPLDGEQDADGDHFSNVEEWRSGTDPTDPASTPVPVTPVVSGITPTVGLTAGGTAITVTGAGFHAKAKLYVGGSPAYETAWVDEHTLVAYTPPGGAGKAAVTVVNPAGNLQGALVEGFRYTANVFDSALVLPVQGWTLLDSEDATTRTFVALVQAPVLGQTVVTTGHGIALTLPGGLSPANDTLRLLIRSYAGIGNLFPDTTPGLPQNLASCAPVLEVNAMPASGALKFSLDKAIAVVFSLGWTPAGCTPDSFRTFYMSSGLDALLKPSFAVPEFMPAHIPDAADLTARTVSLALQRTGVYTVGQGFYVAVPGDVDGDLVLNAQDLQRVINGVIGKGMQYPYADVNNDGTIDARDVQTIINFLLY
ncbi:MAG: IPT/TIG domain-containing protein [FCB group bacterium]|nr:IPT/TIG domain-containing protein [FCB group bacterium]